MIKYLIHQDTTIINLYASNRKDLKYIKKKWIEVQEPETYINLLGYFNIPLSITCKSSEQK